MLRRGLLFLMFLVGRIWTPPFEGHALTRNPAVGSNELLREPRFARSGTVTRGYLICLSTRSHRCRELYLVSHYFSALRGHYCYLPMHSVIDSIVNPNNCAMILWIAIVSIRYIISAINLEVQWKKCLW